MERDNITRVPTQNGIWFQILALASNASAVLLSADARATADLYLAANWWVSLAIDALLAMIMMRGLFATTKVRVGCRQKALIGCFLWWAYQCVLGVDFDGYTQRDAYALVFAVMAIWTLWTDVSRKPRTTCSTP